MSAPAPIIEGDAVDGPLTVLYGQEKWIEPDRPDRLWPKTIKLGRKRPFARPFLFDIRLQPPTRKDLAEFGQEVADAVGLPRLDYEPEPDDRAVWVMGGQWARSASHAMNRDIDSINRMFGGLELVAMALRIWSPS